MRIGLVTGEYPPMQGGVGAYTRVLARTFAQQGHEISIFASAQAQNDDANIQLTNTVTHWGINALRDLKRWSHTQRLDVLNAQYQTAAYGMSPWIHFIPDYIRDLPVVTTFHDLRFPYLFPKAGFLRDWIVIHLASASDGAIVTNHEDYERIRHLPNAALIPIGSNILSRVPPDLDSRLWREKAGAQSDDFLVAYFGFMNRSKGVEPLLESLAALRADGIPARLVLIGGRTGTSDPTNAAYADEIDQRIAVLGLAPYICWTGFVDDTAVAAYLTASDAAALPFLDGASYRRGTLMAAVEHGCAIVTTTPAVPIPTFGDGENMLLVPPNDSAALAAALRQLYESPELRQRLRRGAAELARHFDWSHIARDTVAFFEKIRA